MNRWIGRWQFGAAHNESFTFRIRSIKGRTAVVVGWERSERRGVRRNRLNVRQLERYARRGNLRYLGPL